MYLEVKIQKNFTFQRLQKGCKADLRKFRYSGFFFSVKTNAKGVLQKKFRLSNEEKRSLL